MKKYITLCLLVCLFIAIPGTAQNKSQKPRTIVTTDGELDDVDSFIRMLLHANEFRIEGLVISSSQWHYKGDGKGTKFISELEMTKTMYGERTELRWPGTDWIQFHTFGDSEFRSQSNKYEFLPKDSWLMDRTLAIGYYALVNYSRVTVEEDFLTEKYAWVDINNVPKLLFDHNEMLEMALHHMRINLYH